MSLTASDLTDFLSKEPVAIVAELTAIRGSSPREPGAFMLVGENHAIGTIGGGQLEYLAIGKARQMIRDRLEAQAMDIPLGPEIGQCCGGRVEVELRIVTPAEAENLTARLEREHAARPHVYLFGAGHVGHALARALSLLPLQVHVVDTRPDELAGFPHGVTTHAVALPEALVRSAPTGSAFVILTHDHALDFLIAAEALKRKDSPYVGMVGSKTKRARFSSWFAEQGGSPEALQNLILPIGGKGTGDKRPEVIAALAAAELLVHIGRREVTKDARAAARQGLGAVHGR